MRLNVKALALTVGLISGLAILIVASANLIWPNYGRTFLDLVASVYPGYDPSSGIGSVVTGTLYGFADGAIGGAVFGWLYNLLAHRHSGGAA
ncbi:MAG: hypothetical protein ABI580_13115 [Burkholderiaceae bacterium]